MSFTALNAFRSVTRSTPRVRPQAHTRRFAGAAPAEVVDLKPTPGPGLEKFLDAERALTHHAAQTTDLWRKISYYVCLPAITVCVAWVYNAEVEHRAHLEHIKKEHGGELPPTPEFEYMNRRVKPFPWGMNSLFFNPHTNKNMEEEA